jgi:adenosylmethionine-8-amino-7-oxononanoate aminotransferase
MSVGAESGYHDSFKKMFFKVLSIPFPETWDADDAVEEKEQLALDCLEKYLHQYSEQIAAIILEPLIQGASGMRMCRPVFVKRVVERVRVAGILVIFDEVMTGFGRTGSLFALEQTGVVPDFLCVSKGITGGFLPLALTITTDEVYRAFLSEEWQHAFAHGHSYTANPIACAAAIASFKLLMSDDTQNSIAAINIAHRDGLNYLQNTSNNITKIRLLGTVAAFDLIDTYLEPKIFLQKGLLLRPLGKTVYILPPYSITVAELGLAYQGIQEVISELKL